MELFEHRPPNLKRPVRWPCIVLTAEEAEAFAGQEESRRPLAEEAQALVEQMIPVPPEPVPIFSPDAQLITEVTAFASLAAVMESPREYRPKNKEVACLFIDLDGTIRHGPEELGRFVNFPADVVIFPEVPALLADYRARGFRVFIITNQGGVEAKQMNWHDMKANLERTKELLTIEGHRLFDGLYYCPHWLRNGKLHCFCRKPQIGMLTSASAFLKKAHNEVVSFELSLVVGDRAEDERLAANAGLRFLSAAAWRAGQIGGEL